jgi:hypothetical protein
MIIKTVSYDVDGKSFPSEIEAQQYALLMEHYDLIKGKGAFAIHTVFAWMDQYPERLIELLQNYVAAKKDLEIPAVEPDLGKAQCLDDMLDKITSRRQPTEPEKLITVANFEGPLAYRAGKQISSSTYIHTMDDMDQAAKYLFSCGSKIKAIYFVKSCFNKPPTILEVKAYVESLAYTQKKS